MAVLGMEDNSSVRRPGFPSPVGRLQAGHGFLPGLLPTSPLEKPGRVGLPGLLGHDINRQSLFLASMLEGIQIPQWSLLVVRRDGGRVQGLTLQSRRGAPVGGQSADTQVGLATPGPSASLGVPGGAGSVEAQSPS